MMMRPRPVLPDVGSTRSSSVSSPCARPPDHVGRNAVLDRAERVIPLELGENLGVDEWDDVVEPDHWCRVLGVREQPEHRVVDAA